MPARHICGGNFGNIVQDCCMLQVSGFETVGWLVPVNLLLSFGRISAWTLQYEIVAFSVRIFLALFGLCYWPGFYNNCKVVVLIIF